MDVDEDADQQLEISTAIWRAGPWCEKTGMRTTMARTSMRIHTVWSALFYSLSKLSSTCNF